MCVCASVRATRDAQTCIITHSEDKRDLWASVHVVVVVSRDETPAHSQRSAHARVTALTLMLRLRGIRLLSCRSTHASSIRYTDTEKKRKDFDHSIPSCSINVEATKAQLCTTAAEIYHILHVMRTVLCLSRTRQR